MKLNHKTLTSQIGPSERLLASYDLFTFTHIAHVLSIMQVAIRNAVYAVIMHLVREFFNATRKIMQEYATQCLAFHYVHTALHHVQLYII